MSDAVYTIPEVARLLKVSEDTVYRALTAGTVRAIRVGARRRITQAEVERILRDGMHADIVRRVVRLPDTRHTGKRSSR